MLYIITKLPTDIPIFFANITERTSIPSIAPPKRIARPLPIPEITPPNKAHKSKSVPASGEANVTSTGRISVISHEHTEYIATVYIA